MDEFKYQEVLREYRGSWWTNLIRFAGAILVFYVLAIALSRVGTELLVLLLAGAWLYFIAWCRDRNEG